MKLIKPEPKTRCYSIFWADATCSLPSSFPPLYPPPPVPPPLLPYSLREACYITHSFVLLMLSLCLYPFLLCLLLLDFRFCSFLIIIPSDPSLSSFLGFLFLLTLSFTPELLFTFHPFPHFDYSLPSLILPIPFFYTYFLILFLLSASFLIFFRDLSCHLPQSISLHFRIRTTNIRLRGMGEESEYRENAL
jgi:hypothetical protein